MPFITTIDFACVSAVGFLEQSHQAVRMFRGDHKMNMIGHQAVSPDIQLSIQRSFSNQLQVAPVVRLAKEGSLFPVASLGYVMWVTWYD